MSFDIPDAEWTRTLPRWYCIATVIVCTNTIQGAAVKLEAAGLGGAAELRQRIADGILHSVTIVPAMVVALTQLQERGISYLKVS